MPPKCSCISEFSNAEALNGATVCDPAYLVSKGTRGTCLKYNAAIASGGTRTKPRYWWASTDFRNKHAEAYAILVHFSGARKSVWSEVEDYAIFAGGGQHEHEGPCARPTALIRMVT